MAAHGIRPGLSNVALRDAIQAALEANASTRA
jgi:hypothetical protein